MIIGPNLFQGLEFRTKKPYASLTVYKLVSFLPRNFQDLAINERENLCFGFKLKKIKLVFKFLFVLMIPEFLKMN